MRSIIRKFLSLSLAVALAAAPLTVLASDALGDDLTASSVTVNERTELNAGTFWSNTYSDLRQENYVVYSPNTRVKPVVTGGDYATQLTTVSAAAKALEGAQDSFGVAECFELLRRTAQTVCPTVVSMAYDAEENAVYWCERQNWSDIRKQKMCGRQG